MFRAVELVQERLNRACAALGQANVPYAVIGGNAVAVWVATIDDGAVRNTRDVDLLLAEEDLPHATAALEAVGFIRDVVMDTIVFLDGPLCSWTVRKANPAKACMFCWLGGRSSQNTPVPHPRSSVP